MAPKMITGHWTGGSYTPSDVDKKAYHCIINGDGKVINGYYTIADNESTTDGRYAAHTFNNNTQNIGIAIAAMGGTEVKEFPLVVGKYPIKPIQWDSFIREIASLCKQYNIPVTPKTVMTHAEVETNLGIKQKNKWDITLLPGDENSRSRVRTAKEVGDIMRSEVQFFIDKSYGKPVEIIPKPVVKPVTLTSSPKPVQQFNPVIRWIRNILGIK